MRVVLRGVNETTALIFSGWIGLGGSAVSWNPESKIAFAYTPTMLSWHDLFNENAGRLQEQVVQCYNRLRQQSS